MPRILHVDDNPGDREILQLALETAGAEVALEAVASGQQALDRLLNPHPAGIPDLVILDLNLGSLDGLVVLRKVRAVPTLAGMPIVILTSSIRSSDRGTCLAAGANAYWTKPATWRGFSDVARNVLGTLRGEVPPASSESASPG